MFDIDRFYAAAHSGDPIEIEALRDYFQSFETIVLWGGGNLGKAIGAKLLEMEIPVTVYWDIRAMELGNIHGLKVMEPFHGDFPKDKTLVVACIVNGSSGGGWAKALLAENGFSRVLDGMSLYEAIVCPITRHGKANPRLCLGSIMCNVCACDRFLNNLKNETTVPAGEERLDFNVVTFIVNQKCSLECKHCGQYMNSYPHEKRVNIPLASIKRDIDKFFDAVDMVGVVSIIGGEPFLHPDINDIVAYILSKDNFGALNVTTNGICNITEDMLRGFDSDRVKVTFSDYTKSLSPRQVAVFLANVDLVEKMGIIYSIGTPIWSLPSSLSQKDHTVAEMTAMKRECPSIWLCMSVKNGRFFPCSKTEPVHSLGIVDFETDYVDIANSASAKDLKEDLRSVLARDYYQTCRYCGGDCGELLEQPAEQGVSERYRI